MRKDVMTIDDVARYLRLGRRTIYRLAQLGELPGRKIANRWRFHIDEIEAWLRSFDEASSDLETKVHARLQENKEHD